MKSSTPTFGFRNHRKLLTAYRNSLLCILLLGVFEGSFAQSTSTFFGMNYWEYQTYANGQTVDKFAENMAETSTWNCSIVRIGGNFPNVQRNSLADRDWYVTAINNIKSMNLIPLVQLPIDLTAAETAQWMDYFNITKNLGIVYWGIGNEPDPSNNWDAWYAGTVYQDGYNYVGWRGQFRTIAKAIKAKDANSIICGPDFRHWWGTATSGPLGTWYKDFLYGASGVGTDTYNGDPIVDIFAFHFYGDANEATMIGRYAILKSMIDATNALRPANQPLKIAVGEYNTEVSIDPGVFSAGQYMAIMAKQALANGAAYFTPWSVEEGNKFRMLESNGTLRSTAQHMKMLSQNKRGNYMTGQIENNMTSNIMEFGMQDANGYTVMLMNKSATDYSFSVKFSTTAGNYSAANTALKFRFNANENIDFSNLTLYKNSTLLFTFDAAGNMLKKIEYRSGYTAPVVTNYPVSNTPPSVNITAPAASASFAAGTAITLTANASDAAPGTVTSVAFYDGVTLLGSDVSSPYSYTWSGAGTGSHSITAKATDNNGAVTTSSAVSITVTAVNDSLTLSYFHFVNKWTTDYMRPTAGGLTSTITQYEEQAGTTPTLDSYDWEFRTVTGTNYYYIINRYTQNAIQPTNGSIADNVGLSQTTLTASNQAFTELHWSLIPSDEAPYYWIRNRKSNLYIRPNGGTNGTGVPIVQNTINTALSSFKWNLIDQGLKSVASQPFSAVGVAQSANPEKINTSGNVVKKGIAIYPNPADDIITINTEVEYSSAVRVKIYNTAGNLMFSKEYLNSMGLFAERINISTLAAGIYVLKIQKGNHTTSQKLIKK